MREANHRRCPPGGVPGVLRICSASNLLFYALRLAVLNRSSPYADLWRAARILRRMITSFIIPYPANTGVDRNVWDKFSGS
jgi:hypothetical protein